MQLTVTSKESGQKLLKYLLRKTDGTKIFLFKCFRKKKILVAGKPVDSGYIIQENDQIDCPVLSEKNVQPKFKNVVADIRILNMTTGLVAVDKPEGVLVHAAKGKDYSETLIEKTRAVLHNKNESWEFLVPVHRLDQNTSGVVLFARDFETAKAVNELIRQGQIKKTYTALLEGALNKRIFVTADIMRDHEFNFCLAANLGSSEKIPDKKTWMTNYYEESSTISATVISPVKSNGYLTLCRIELWTGRHHQIRAVCKGLGHPICGDKKYGSKREARRGQELVCSRMEIPALEFVAESRFSLTLPNE